MALKYFASATTYKKQQNWETGPCKPTVVTSDTTAENAVTLINGLASDIRNLTSGESVTIVVTCSDVPST